MNRKANPWASLAALTLLVVILVTVCSGCEAVEASAENATRFEITYAEIIGGTRLRVITDTKTGTEYLLIGAGQGYGLTVLQPGTAETEGASQ